MAFYELETKDRKSITYFEVYYYREHVTDKYQHLKYKFNIHFQEAYEVSKSYNELQDKFVKELQQLQTNFYDLMFDMIERNKIKFFIEEGTDYKIIEEEKKKVYDYMLPQQKAFAEKWGLVTNVD